MNNIIDCRLDSTCKEIYTGIWQHDYGQILRITGVDLPKAVEVQFSLRDKGGDTLTRIGTTVDGVTEVKVPDSFLKNENCTQNYLIYAWIYVTDDASGNTEYQIILHVKSRPKPEEPSEEPLPEPNIFHETVEAVNASADRAETAEKNAKASETEAGKYAASASESATAAEKTKEDALREVGEKKQEAIEAIQEQEETSVGKITTHTDDEIQRIQDQTAESKGELEQSITNAGASKKELDESIQIASDTKTALDKSVELAGTAKTGLDTSIREAGEAKTALDGSTKTAGEMQETLSATVKQAGALDTSLGEKIETGAQLKTDLTASGEKAVQDIQTAGSEQLGKMQTVAEEFTADREQITTNKEDISSLKEEMGKNYLDDVKVKRSLDALWKLNQGISYQFETDDSKAYQKDIPSGAKLVSVKKIGGRTIVWNQLANVATKNNVYLNDRNRAEIKIDSAKNTITATLLSEPVNNYHTYITYTVLRFEKGHKYLFSAFFKSNKDCVMRFDKFESSKMTTQNLKSNIERLCADILICNEDDANNSIPIYPTEKDSGFSVGDWYSMRDFKLFDLTKMFGAGNEPSTPEEFEALFPEDYYEYNEGTLMSMSVNEVVERGRNLLPDYLKIGKVNGITIVRNRDGSLTVSGTSSSNDLFKIGYVSVEKGKKYKLTGTPVGGSSKTYRLWVTSRLAFPEANRLFDTGLGGEATALEDEIIEAHIQVMSGVTVKDLTFRPMLTYADKEGDFSPYHKNTYPIPQAILELDGYGDGVSEDVYNYVDWENKEYHKRVGRVDLGSLTYTNNGTASDGSIQWKSKEKISKKEGSYACMCPVFAERRASGTIVPITNGICDLREDCSISLGYIGVTNAEDFAQAMQGIMLYYELAEEEIIDISDIIDNTFQEPFEVEAGGTLIFQNSNGDGYRLPIPSEEEYIVSLAEVGGGASE